MTYSELVAFAEADAVGEPVVAEARRLAQSEPSLRTAVLHAVLLLRAGKPAEAEQALGAARAQYGDAPVVLINLAKVAQARGDVSASLQWGRAAVGKNPDDEIALGFWSSSMRLAGRERELLAELPKLPGFRPQLALGAWHLEHGARAEAKAAWQAALTAAGDTPACAETLARDLRAYGEQALLVEVLAPHYRLETHGPFAGLVLAGAHAELGQLEQAQALLDAVRTHVPEAGQRLVSELEALVVRKRVEAEPAEGVSLRSAPLIGPVWAAPLLRAGLAFPPRPPGSRLVAFAQLADCTNDRAVTTDEPSLDAPTPVERACRAVPLLLSEALTLSTAATGMALIPTHGDRGLITFRKPLELEVAVQLASAQAVPQVLVTGLFSRGLTSELELELTLHDLTGRSEPETLRLSKGAPEELAARAEREVKAALKLAEEPAAFTRPPRPDARLLDVTHRVLTLVLGATGRLDRHHLHGLSASLEAAQELVRAMPGVDTPALLLAAAQHAGHPQTGPYAATVRALLAPFPWAKSVDTPA